MRYVIASRSMLQGAGISPVSPVEIDGNTVANENELRYRFPGKNLEEITESVDGIIVDRVAALDFIHGRKTFNELKNNGK